MLGVTEPITLTSAQAQAMLDCILVDQLVNHIA